MRRQINTCIMQSFKNWLTLHEGLQIIHIDPEEDWEMADQAYQIAKLVNIRASRNKNPTIIALNDKQDVIGAAFTSWEDDHDMTQQVGEPVAHWDFDVVVHPQWQGYEMVGMKLIRQAEAEKKNLEGQYGQRAYSRMWVVNPKLQECSRLPSMDTQPIQSMRMVRLILANGIERLYKAKGDS